MLSAEVLVGANHHSKTLLAEVDEIFKCAIGNVSEPDRNSLGRADFYEVFMRPYYSSFPSRATDAAFKVIDLSHSGRIEWEKWRFWLIWALNEYHDEISSVDQLLECVFTRAIFPMQIHLLAEEQAKLATTVPRLSSWLALARARRSGVRSF